MMTLLRGLHAIAAQRGDGLRPELLAMITPSPAWSSIEKLGDAMPGKSAPLESQKNAPQAEIVPLRIRKR